MAKKETSSCEFSKEFKQHLDVLTKQWKTMLKKSKKIMLKCPNFEKCEYKCGSIGGMQYHYPRCAGACPVFKCNKCGKEYESRTGLNYHNSSYHSGSPPLSDGVSRSRVRPKEYVPPAPLPNDTIHESPPPVKKKKKSSKSKVQHHSSSSSVSDESIVTDSVKKDIATTPTSPPTNTPITVPSIEYPEKYRSFLPVWRDEFKANQIVTCPNHKCQYQCSTVNGMKYHYIRCQKEKLPEFECSLCSKSFHCRSGLVWHLKNLHKVDDHLLTNQKTIQSVSNKPGSGKRSTVNKRGRKKAVPLNNSPPLPSNSDIKKQKRSRKNGTPRRTAMSVLNNIITSQSRAWIGAPPRLQSPPTRIKVTPTEFNITEPIPTDNIQYGSLTVDYPLEVLTQWHKWYSDSDSTSDEEEEKETGAKEEGIKVERKIKEIKEDSDDSSSLSEDNPSDEDYKGSSGRGRGGRGRGSYRSRGRGKGKDAVVLTATRPPPPLKSDVKLFTSKPTPPIQHSVAPNTIKPPIPKLISTKPSNTPLKQKLVTSVKQENVLVKAQKSSNYVQYYQVPVQSLPSNLVPVQLISRSTSNIQNVQLPTANGGLVLLQPSGSQTVNRTPQRVSVIMNPRSVMTLPVSEGSTTKIIQLDGPKGKGRGKARNKEQLNEDFEKTRDSVTPSRKSTNRKRKKQSIDEKEDESEEGSTTKRRKTNDSTPSREVSLTCYECSTTFSCPSKLETHIATTHLSFSPEATLAERAPVWRQVIKKYKYMCCDKCLAYKAKSVSVMKYHFERCGKDIEVLKCPECGKEYTTKGGLEYHMKTVHTTEEDLEESLSVPQDETPVDYTGVQRTAALEATNKLQKMTVTTSEKEVIKDNLLITPSTEVKEVPQLQELKQLFKKNEAVLCPKGCGQSYKSYLGLKYHLENGHLLKKKYKCPYCKYVIDSKKRIVSHLESKHEKIIEKADDLEYVASLSNEEAEEEDEEEEVEVMNVSKRKKGSIKKTANDKDIKVKNRTFFGGKSYTKSIEIIQENLLSQSILYPQWRPHVNHFQKLSENEVEEYLPLHRESMSYNINEQTYSLPLFHGSDDHLMYVGGPVWSMDWHPSTVEYVALSSYQSYNETFGINPLLVHKGLIQIWKLGQINENQNCVPNPSFGFGIAHNWGCIREMKWCPSGTQDTVDFIQTNDGHMSRLGLLAVACSDGLGRILSIPYPKELSQSFSSSSPLHVVISNVSAILKARQIECGQCLCIQWLPKSPHATISAGFSSGLIAIWSLDESLSFLKSSQSKDLVLYPMIQILAHTGPVRCLAWCPRDSNYLFSGGSDKLCCLWDLRQPLAPLQKTERIGIIVRAIWPTMWPGIFVIEDSPKIVSLCFLTFCTEGLPVMFSVTKYISPVSCFDYSAKGDKILMGTFSGDLSCVNMLPSAYNTHFKRKPYLKRNVLMARLEKIEKCDKENDGNFKYGIDELSDIITEYKVLFTTGLNVTENVCEPDSIPLTAVTNCAIKVLDQHHTWYLCAFNNGFVKLITMNK